MTGFQPRTTSIRSDHSAILATPLPNLSDYLLLALIIIIYIKYVHTYKGYFKLSVKIFVFA